ncbi:MAG: hypothetical protein J5I90_04180 [Caldilineales bacterium]|nr:hypothetical protein [Caldilineales bacterium]
MTTQNITLAIPKEILRKAKRIALERNTSLSGLLTETLVEITQQEDAYNRARKKHLALLEEGFDLGTHGEADWDREELHDRKY